MNRRGRHHSHLKLSTCDKENCLVILVAQLRKENRLQNVTSLSMDLNGEWASDLRLLALFPNLNSLQLRPFLRSDLNPSSIETLQKVRDNSSCIFSTEADFTCPSVQTLVWNMNADISSEEYPIWLSISKTDGIAPFLRMLPNVSHLKFFNVEKDLSSFIGLLSTSLTLLPKVTHLACIPSNERNEIEKFIPRFIETFETSS